MGPRSLPLPIDSVIQSVHHKALCSAEFLKGVCAILLPLPEWSHIECQWTSKAERFLTMSLSRQRFPDCWNYDITEENVPVQNLTVNFYRTSPSPNWGRGNHSLDNKNGTYWGHNPCENPVCPWGKSLAHTTVEQTGNGGKAELLHSSCLCLWSGYKRNSMTDCTPVYDLPWLYLVLSWPGCTTVMDHPLWSIQDCEGTGVGGEWSRGHFGIEGGGFYFRTIVLLALLFLRSCASTRALLQSPNTSLLQSFFSSLRQFASEFFFLSVLLPQFPLSV